MPRRKKETETPKQEKLTELQKEVGKGAEIVDLDALNKSVDAVLTDLDNRTGSKRGTLKGEPEFDMLFLELGTRLSAAGVKESDIAFFMGVQQKDIDRWKKKIPQFKDSLNRGKNLAKSFLIAQGLRAAGGYDYVERNVTYKTKVLADGTCIKYPESVSEYHKHQPPNPQLLMFMLCNLSRQLDEGEDMWTSAHKIEVDRNENINISIDGNLATEQINKLAGKIMEQESGRRAIESKVVDNET